jgi:hypothetical protein
MLFVGARGSGESSSSQLAMGTTVYPIYTGLRAANRRITGYGWPYNADRPTGAGLRHAAAGLDDFLRARARHCPGERVILAGYSDGAQVVGDALQSMALSAPVRRGLEAAVLLADPEFNPADTTTTAGTFRSNYGGSPRRPAFPVALADRIRSYCRRHDVVCQRGDSAASKDQHGEYQPQQTCLAVRFIESITHERRSNC